MKYCSNCGKEIQDGALYCERCGSSLNETTKTPEKKEKGTSMSIVALVFGVIAIVFSFSALTISPDVAETLTNESPAYRIGYAIGYNIFAEIATFIGFILSVVSLGKTKNTMNILGIIFSSVSLFFLLLTLIMYS